MDLQAFQLVIFVVIITAKVQASPISAEDRHLNKRRMASGEWQTLSEEQKATAEKVFSGDDLDGNGLLTPEEITTSFRRFGMRSPDLETQVQEQMNVTDTDKSGTIDLPEFLAMLERVEPEGPRETFNLLDASGDGFIDADEMRNFLALHGRESRLECVMHRFDDDGNGKIDFEEYEQNRGYNDRDAKIDFEEYEQYDFEEYEQNRGSNASDATAHPNPVWWLDSIFDRIHGFLKRHLFLKDPCEQAESDTDTDTETDMAIM